MNTYKITFQREDGTTGYGHFAATTEKQAQRDFKEVCRHPIISIELVGTNAPATKEQERKAVEKIRKIISELGEGSYVGTALEGCLEDAESNIENDFGDSMKRRWEYSEEQLKAAQEEIASLKDKLAESEKDYEAAHAAAHEICEEKDAEIAALRQQTILADDLTDCIQLVENGICELEQKVKKAEQIILENAEHPETTDFCNAVRERKNLNSDIGYYKALKERLTAIQTAQG